MRQLMVVVGVCGGRRLVAVDVVVLCGVDCHHHQCFPPLVYALRHDRHRKR